MHVLQDGKKKKVGVLARTINALALSRRIVKLWNVALSDAVGQVAGRGSR